MTALWLTILGGLLLLAGDAFGLPVLASALGATVFVAGAGVVFVTTRRAQRTAGQPSRRATWTGFRSAARWMRDLMP